MTKEATVTEILRVIRSKKPTKAEEAINYCKSLYFYDQFKPFLSNILIELVFSVVVNNPDNTDQEIINACLFGNIQFEEIENNQTVVSSKKRKLDILQEMILCLELLNIPVIVVPDTLWIIDLSGSDLDLDNITGLIPQKSETLPPTALPIYWSREKFNSLIQSRGMLFQIYNNFPEFRNLTTNMYAFKRLNSIEINGDILFRSYITGKPVLKGIRDKVEFSHFFINNEIVLKEDMWPIISNELLKPITIPSWIINQFVYILNEITYKIAFLARIPNGHRLLPKLVGVFNPPVKSILKSKIIKISVNHTNIIEPQISDQTNHCVHITAFHEIEKNKADFVNNLTLYLKEYTVEKSGHYSCVYCGVDLVLLSTLIYDLINVDGQALYYSRVQRYENIFNFEPYKSFNNARYFIGNIIQAIDRQAKINSYSNWMSIAKLYLDTLFFITANKQELLRQHAERLKNTELFFFALNNDIFLQTARNKEFYFMRKNNNLYMAFIAAYCVYLDAFSASKLYEKFGPRNKSDSKLNMNKVIYSLLVAFVRNKFIEVEKLDYEILTQIVLVYASLNDQYIFHALAALDKRLTKLSNQSKCVLNITHISPEFKLDRGMLIRGRIMMPLPPIQSTIFDIKLNKMPIASLNNPILIDTIVSSQSKDFLRLVENQQLIIKHDNIKYSFYSINNGMLNLVSGSTTVQIKLDTLKETQLSLHYIGNVNFNLLHAGQKIPLLNYYTPSEVESAFNGIEFMIRGFNIYKFSKYKPTTIISKATLDLQIYKFYLEALQLKELLPWMETNQKVIKNLYRYYQERFFQN